MQYRCVCPYANKQTGSRHVLEGTAIFQGPTAPHSGWNWVLIRMAVESTESFAPKIDIRLLDLWSALTGTDGTTNDMTCGEPTNSYGYAQLCKNEKPRLDFELWNFSSDPDPIYPVTRFGTNFRLGVAGVNIYQWYGEEIWRESKTRSRCEDQARRFKLCSFERENWSLRSGITHGIQQWLKLDANPKCRFRLNPTS